MRTIRSLRAILFALPPANDAVAIICSDANLGLIRSACYSGVRATSLSG